MKRLTQKVWNANQSVYYESLWEISCGDTKKKVKIEIRRNTYDFQSWARSSLFDGNKWNGVALIPCEHMDSLKVNAFCKDVQPSNFSEDEAELLEETKMLIK